MKAIKVIVTTLLFICLIPFAILAIPAAVLMLTINSINGQQPKPSQPEIQDPS